MNEKRFEKLLERIGCGLEYLRLQKGFTTMKDFAANYKLPGIQYWRIERGKTNIRFNTLMDLLAIHNLSLEEFFEIVRREC